MEIEHDDIQSETTGSLYKSEQYSTQNLSQHSKSQESNQISLELVVLNENDNEKCEVQQKLKKQQQRKIKIQNKINKIQSSSTDLIPSQRKYVYEPYGLNIAPSEDYFVFGEIVLEGDFFKDPYNLDKTYQWSYWKRGDQACHMKDINCTSVDMKRRVQTDSNFEYAIYKYLNIPDQQMHELGVLLQEYYQKTMLHLQIMKQRGNLINNNKYKDQLAKLSQNYYQKSLEWMRTKVKSDEIYMYAFYEIDLETTDQNYRNIGYSQNLLNLVGLDENTAIPFILRKGRLEFIDGLSSDFSLEHDIITIDDLRIPTKCTVSTPNFNCLTPQNFEYYDLFFGGFMFEYSMFRLFKFDINPKIIEQITLERSLQTKDQAIDFEYSLMSELFIDKFYKQTDEEIEKKKRIEQQLIEQNKTKMCGFRKL